MRVRVWKECRGWLLLVPVLFSCSCAKHAAQQAKLAVPGPASLHGQLGRDRQVTNAFEAGDGDYLLRRMRDEVIAHPDDLAARLALGSGYLERGYVELAIEHYRLATERFPDSAEPQLVLAKALRASSHTVQAADGLASFLERHPQKSPRYASWLGILRDEAGDWTAGEAAHRRALELARAAGADQDFLHNNLGYCLLMQHKAAMAAVEFRAALRLNAQSAIARDNLGVALAADPKEAVLNWQSISEPATAHSNMAAILIEQHKFPEAREEIQRALSYNKFHSAALANLKLVSDLDGKPAMISPKPTLTRWSRWKSKVGRWLGPGPAESAEKGDLQTAAR